MTKNDRIRKEKTIAAMCRTAKMNGKTKSRTEMTKLADRLHRIESTLSRLATKACDSEFYTKTDEDRQIRLENLAETLIRENIGCRCYTQRDPRGLAIRMYLNDYSNTWDGTAGLAW